MLTRSRPTKAQAWGFAWKDSIRHVFTAINWWTQRGKDGRDVGMKGLATEVWMSVIVPSAAPTTPSTPLFLFPQTPPCFPLSFWAIVSKCPLNDAKEQTPPPSHFPPPPPPPCELWVLFQGGGMWWAREQDYTTLIGSDLPLVVSDTHTYTHTDITASMCGVWLAETTMSWSWHSPWGKSSIVDLTVNLVPLFTSLTYTHTHV